MIPICLPITDRRNMTKRGVRMIPISLPLVLLHLAFGNPSAVLADAQPPAASVPSGAAAKDKIGEALADRKDDKGAIKAYDEAIRLKSDYADAYIDRGLSHWNLRRTQVRQE